MARKWSCPLCKNTIVMPNRVNPTDPRRYCLDCSSGQKQMVKRICPAAIREREAVSAKKVAVKQAATRKKEKKLSGWNNMHDEQGWSRVSNGEDPQKIMRYVLNQTRLGVRPDIVGKVVTRRTNAIGVNNVWLVNQLKGHPIYAVYLGLLLNNGNTQDSLIHRTQWGQVLKWANRAAHRWESPLKVPIRVTSTSYATRASKVAALEFMREGFENWFEKNWVEVIKRCLPPLSKPKVRAKGTRTISTEPAKWLVDPLPMVWTMLH